MGPKYTSEEQSRSSHLNVLCDKGVLKKFHNINRKTPVSESLF